MQRDAMLTQLGYAPNDHLLHYQTPKTVSR